MLKTDKLMYLRKNGLLLVTLRNERVQLRGLLLHERRESSLRFPFFLSPKSLTCAVAVSQVSSSLLENERMNDWSHFRQQ